MLTNVTITENTSSDFGGGISIIHLVNEEWVSYTESNPVLVNTILWNNSPDEIYNACPPDSGSISLSYSDVQGGLDSIGLPNGGAIVWGEGNIDANPLFCLSDSGDYTLAENSPCVGTGENGANMGAFGVGCEDILSTDMDVIPLQYVLHQNYPNPFNPVTKIRFDLPEDADVQLLVYDVLGREVAELVSGRVLSGFHEVIWDASDVSSGIYLCQLTTLNSVITNKMVVVK